MRRCGFAMLAAAALAVTVSCVTGKRAEDKTGLDRLNGESYMTDSSATLMAQPVIPLYIGDQKQRTTKVTGAVWRGEGIEKTPVGQAVVQIVKDGKVLAEVTSAPNGDFKLFPVLPNGGYTLRAQSGELKSEMPFYVKGYEVKDLNITIGK
jgi:hypothetical protein